MRGHHSGAFASVTVTDLAQDGRGVAHIHGKATFIAGALPGERVRCQVVKTRSSFDEAKLVEIEQPSAQRVTPRCRHFGVCGGCSLQHLSSDAQVIAKEKHLLDALERIGGVRPRAVLAPLRGLAWAYRRRARLSAKFVQKKARVLVGFHERAGRYVADLERCEVLAASMQDLPAQLAALIQSLDIAAHVPQIELAAGDEARVLVFRILREPTPTDFERLRAFASTHDYDLRLQREGPESLAPLPGDPHGAQLADAPEPGVRLEFDALDFVQVNASVNAAMVRRVCDELGPSPQDRALELFCGIGNFSVPLARRAAQVTAIELSRAAIRRAEHNAALNGCTNVHFHAQDLFQPSAFGAWAQQRYDWVLLDPPRAGAVELMECMSQWQPRRVVYISCHPGTLARDAGLLTRTHGFELAAAGVMDMFAQTMHVESMAVFERRM